MTQEDIAFDGIIKYITSDPKLHLISAHPPSGKSYTTDLIRFPSPTQKKTGAERYHVDIIFCSSTHLFLCEVKGSTAESQQDILKLNSLISHYSVDKLKKFIIDRLTTKCDLLNLCNNVVICIGAYNLNSNLEDNVLYLISDGSVVGIHSSTPMVDIEH
ncbi:hypothetical protein [Geobacter sp. AOG1]|uniref:hypothetical protein n=1 Tax=Geobacter sp. AOG1 TaxID=1566346 RepID=UPI001CC6661D|nr:hypothetical protein [Geobacter sp. AOG1]